MGELYSSTLSLTPTLDGGWCTTRRFGRFTPGKETCYPLYRILGESQRFGPQTVQPIQSRYTYWAIPVNRIIYKILFTSLQHEWDDVQTYSNRPPKNYPYNTQMVLLFHHFSYLCENVGRDGFVMDFSEDAVLLVNTMEKINGQTFIQ